MQQLLFPSSSHEQNLGSERLFLQSLLISKCLKLFDISSSSSSLELQVETTESNCSSVCNLAVWQSCNLAILVALASELIMANGPDLFSGILCRAGDVLLKGVWHLDVVELLRGVISVPTSLCFTSWATSVAASDMEYFPPKFANTIIGSEDVRFGKMGSTSFVNLSAARGKNKQTSGNP